MQKITIRLISVCLSLVMMLSLMPLQAFSESHELPDELATILPSNESLAEEPRQEPLSLPDGQTIILPVVENLEGKEKDFPKSENKNNGLISLFSTDINTVYAPTGVNSYYINGRIYLDTTNEPVSGAILQVLAADGESVLANTSGIDYYYHDHETGYYYINYEYITILQGITAGTYSMQLVAAEEKIPSLTNIKFTDQLFLASVDLYNLYIGSDTCEVYVHMYNSSEIQLEQLAFSLIDSNNNIVGQTSGAYRELSLNNNEHQISGYTLMNISGSVDQYECYRLALTYSGAGTLCDGTGGIAGFNHYPSSDMYPEITNLEVTDPKTSELIVHVDNLETSFSYILTIRDGYYGKILHQSTVTGANSPFVINLTFNGLIVPLTSFNAERFYVEVQQDSGYEYDSKDFRNPYYGSSDTGDAYYSFHPYYINPNSTTLPFTLIIQNATSAYSGGTNFTISVKTENETEELASISGDKTTIVRDGYTYEISGILNFSSLPNETDLYIYFNTAKVSYAYITDDLHAYYGYEMRDWEAKTFWLMMDQLYLKTDVINSSGTAKLVLKDESGFVVSQSSVVTGTTSEYYNHLNYEFSFSPQLINGKRYSLFLVDGTKEYQYFSDTENTFDGEFSFNRQNDFDVSTYNVSVGDTLIEGRIYGHECKNMTSEYLSSFLQSIVLKDAARNINSITGYTNGRFEYGTYCFDITLTSPLSVGYYTLTYPDGGSSNFTVYESSVEDKSPKIYRNDAGDGYVYGEYLPTNAIYTAKIYKGYTCLSNDPFTLTLNGEYANNSTQCLYIPNDVISGLTIGTYEVRIYKDGVLLGAVPLTIPSKPQQTVVSAYDPFNRGNVLLSTSGYILFGVLGGDQYTELRFSESLEELSSEPYTRSFNAIYELSYGDGEKTLYVQLKDGNGDESEIFYLKIYRLVDAPPTVYVHEAQQGVYGGNNVSLSLGADTQYLNAFVDFINADGITLATASLEYKGLGEVTAFGAVNSLGNSGVSDELKHIYSSTINTTSWSSNLGWNYDYFDSLGISHPNLQETGFVRFYLGTDNYFNQTILSEVIERFLFFGSLDNIVMPQFSSLSSYRHSTNDENIALRGFATPNSTVTLTADDNQGGGFLAEVQTNEYGYFTYTAEGIDEGEYIITASDDNGLSLAGTSRLIVDRTPPTISLLGFTFIDNQNVAVQWTCLDTDVSEFRLFVNGVRVDTITNPSGPEYNRNILSKYGNSFMLVAVDKIGNETIITREIGDKDVGNISAVLSCPSSVEPGDSFVVGIDLDNLNKDIFAQDITLTYDADVFKYVSVSSLYDNIKILKEDTATEGRVRLIAANIGGLSGNDNRILNLIFKVKDGIDNAVGDIAITSAKLGVAPEGTVIEAGLDSKSITIENTQPVIDKTALIAAINNAQTLYDSAVVGTQPGEYPQEGKDALYAAINVAKVVRNNAYATQSEVDNAVIALNDAVEIFKASVNKSADLNNNGTIDVGDLAIVAYYYGINSESPTWDEAKIADLNSDNIIDIADLAYIALNIPD